MPAVDGAAADPKCSWDQDETEVTVTVPCDGAVRARDVVCKFTSVTMVLAIKGQTVFHQPYLEHPINHLESHWQMDGEGSTRAVCVTLSKAAKKTWNKVFLQHNPRAEPITVDSVELAEAKKSDASKSATGKRRSRFPKPSLRLSLVVLLISVLLYNTAPPIYHLAQKCVGNDYPGWFCERFNNQESVWMQGLAWTKAVGWRYTNWRDGVEGYHRVGPNLLVGDLSMATASGTLSSLGVTHVVVVSQFGNTMKLFPSQFEYHVIPARDRPGSPLNRTFDAATDFIASGVTEGGSVMVHSHYGFSRAPTIVAAYLMRTKGLTVDDALDLIELNRRHTDPNQGFVKQLREYGACLKREGERCYSWSGVD
eukprot:TRINITY_DN26741_c0_g1_i1.p1 TRINITY_DN26741_c0_g1~~TRINITY_DN26741_c0_g1_i1.p1  ORF type:complete len:380 (+),score=96.15 TRINITY_DN26741_c0_g1_i1:42-1142(+)